MHQHISVIPNVAYSSTRTKTFNGVCFSKHVQVNLLRYVNKAAPQCGDNSLLIFLLTKLRGKSRFREGLLRALVGLVLSAAGAWVGDIEGAAMGFLLGELVLKGLGGCLVVAVSKVASIRWYQCRHKGGGTNWGTLRVKKWSFIGLLLLAFISGAQGGSLKIGFW